MTEEITYNGGIDTIIHGLFASSNTTTNIISNTFDPVSPFDQLTISFRFWSIDIDAMGSQVQFKIDGVSRKTFEFNDPCSGQDQSKIEWDMIYNTSIDSDINNKTLICVEGRYTIFALN